MLLSNARLDRISNYFEIRFCCAYARDDFEQAKEAAQIEGKLKKNLNWYLNSGMELELLMLCFIKGGFRNAREFSGARIVLFKFRFAGNTSCSSLFFPNIAEQGQRSDYSPLFSSPWFRWTHIQTPVAT